MSPLGRKDNPTEQVCLEAALAELSSPNPSYLQKNRLGALPLRTLPFMARFIFILKQLMGIHRDIQLKINS